MARRPTASAEKAPAAVETTSLHKRYGDVQALRGVDLRVETRNLFGLRAHTPTTGLDIRSRIGL